MNILTIPTVCPRCGQPTSREKKNDSEFLVCTNPNCGAKIEGKLLHFVGAHGLDIESMSTATVRDLINLGWLVKMSDIFTLKNHRDAWINLKGYGENSVDKILEAIPTSLELWKVIASAGIPNVEKQTASLLAEKFVTWNNFMDAINTKYDFTLLPGIGNTTAEVISNFDYSEINEVMNYLTIKEKVVGGKLDNMSFCITGSLNTYSNRDELVKVIEANGGKIAGVNKNLTYLICNDKTSTSGKSKKAKDLGIKVITEEEFNALIS
jgi:DNA ligase (NAD+)